MTLSPLTFPVTASFGLPAMASADDSLPQQLAALWAPWRAEYFELPRPVGDFLLDAAQAGDDAAALVVLRRKSAFLLMNKFPYAGGHLMAVPYRKVPDLSDLHAEEKLELLGLAEAAQAILRRALRAQGFNIGLNLGACAGAGAPDHLHLHIVPRWAGDTNFLPVLAGTRVIPEALVGTYAKLVQARDELGFGG